jgi:two-component system, OmpR family, response regulator
LLAKADASRNFYDMEIGKLQRVMMVEDDTDIQMVARLSLEAVGGYVVEICSDGKEALDKVQLFAPDLVLLDVMMPDMDGPTVLKNLRANPKTANLPVVFMTAKAQAHEVESYKAMGALEVVSKPFDPMLLPGILAGIWQKLSAEQATSSPGGDPK